VNGTLKGVAIAGALATLMAPAVAFAGKSKAMKGDPLDQAYLVALRELADRIQPAIVSDHLCWGRHGGRGSPTVAIAKAPRRQSEEELLGWIRSATALIARRSRPSAAPSPSDAEASAEAPAQCCRGMTCRSSSSEHFYVAEPDIFIFLLRRLAGFLK